MITKDQMVHTQTELEVFYFMNSVWYSLLNKSSDGQKYKRLQAAGCQHYRQL